MAGPWRDAFLGSLAGRALALLTLAFMVWAAGARGWSVLVPLGLALASCLVFVAIGLRRLPGAQRDGFERGAAVLYLGGLALGLAGLLLNLFIQ